MLNFWYKAELYVLTVSDVKLNTYTYLSNLAGNLDVNDSSTYFVSFWVMLILLHNSVCFGVKTIDMKLKMYIQNTDPMFR